MEETWKSRRTGGKISKWRDLQADRERNREVDKGKCRQKKRPAVKKGNARRQREEQAGRQTEAQTEEMAGSEKGKCRKTGREGQTGRQTEAQTEETDGSEKGKCRKTERGTDKQTDGSADRRNGRQWRR
jgi:hypothetical protein